MCFSAVDAGFRLPFAQCALIKSFAVRQLMAVHYVLLLTALAAVSLALGSTGTDAEEDSLDLLVEPVTDYHNSSSLSGTIVEH